MIYIYALLGISIVSIAAWIFLTLEAAWRDMVNNERWRGEQ